MDAGLARLNADSGIADRPPTSCPDAARRPRLDSPYGRSYTGVLRLVSKSAKCAAGERKISWNSVGPQGHPGVVNGFVDNGSPSIAIGGSTTVATLQLPAGKYVVSASVSFTNSGTSGSVECHLLNGSTVINQALATLVPDSFGNQSASMSLGGASTGGTIVVLCGTSGAHVSDFNPVITAIPVNALTVTSK